MQNIGNRKRADDSNRGRRYRVTNSALLYGPIGIGAATGLSTAVASGSEADASAVIVNSLSTAGATWLLERRKGNKS